MTPELRSALEEAHVELQRKMFRLDKRARTATGEHRDTLHARSKRLFRHVLQIHDALNAGRHRETKGADALDRLLSGEATDGDKATLRELRDRLRGAR